MYTVALDLASTLLEEVFLLWVTWSVQRAEPQSFVLSIQAETPSLPGAAICCVLPGSAAQASYGHFQFLGDQGSFSHSSAIILFLLPRKSDYWMVPGRLGRLGRTHFGGTTQLHTWTLLNSVATPSGGFLSPLSGFLILALNPNRLDMHLGNMSAFYFSLQCQPCKTPSILLLLSSVYQFLFLVLENWKTVFEFIQVIV